MLEDYKEKQPLVYNYVSKMLDQSKIFHAYLIETKNVNYGFDIALSLSKSFLCPNNYKNNNNSNCSNCSICLNIDKNNYPDIKIIENDTKIIKKEQLLELQKEFSVKPLYGKYLIYIIKNAELLNKSSANTILKFLEEPNPNIIAILITNNIYNCLDTIVSRCQILSLLPNDEIDNNIFNKLYENSDKNISFSEFINKEINNIFEIYEKIETEKTKVIALEDLSLIKEKMDVFFTIGMRIYIDILNYKLNRNIEYFSKYENKIKKINEFNEIDDIIRKIEIINDFQKKLNYNINKELFINNFIITFTGRKFYD